MNYNYSVVSRKNENRHLSGKKNAKEGIMHNIRLIKDLKNNNIISEKQLRHLLALLVAMYIQDTIEEKIEESVANKFDQLILKKLVHG